MLSLLLISAKKPILGFCIGRGKCVKLQTKFLSTSSVSIFLPPRKLLWRKLRREKFTSPGNILTFIIPSVNTSSRSIVQKVQSSDDRDIRPNTNLLLSWRDKTSGNRGHNRKPHTRPYLSHLRFRCERCQFPNC